MARKRVLFIDRDGTLIIEPPVDFQVDSLEKLDYYPGVFGGMSRIKDLDYELVMVTNQDGLGTKSFPEDSFWPVQNRMIKTFEGEGIHFNAVLIDKSFTDENKPTRKPGTGMLTSYMDGSYDLENSYVIGDRVTDIILARNLGAKGILVQTQDCGEDMIEDTGLEGTCVLITDDWTEIYSFLRFGDRVATIERKTRETDIKLTLDLDGRGENNIYTGLHFFDHMLEQIIHHAGVSINLDVKGDLHVDEHHTIEDVAIVLGQAIYQSLGSKLGIERYGYCLPMDECDATVLLDFGGRIDFMWNVEFKREKIGDVPTEMFCHFFKSLCEAAKCNLHISATGENEHHKIEGIFKAFSRALKMAIARNPMSYSIPSSKGAL